MLPLSKESTIFAESAYFLYFVFRNLETNLNQVSQSVHKQHKLNGSALYCACVPAIM